MRSKAPFIGRRMSSRLPTSLFYPIGFSLENYRTLFYNIHSFEADIFSQVTSLEPDASNTILLPVTEDSSVVGEARRRIRLLGELNEDGSELTEGQKPFVNRDYPTFLGGSGGGIVSINFGRTVFHAGLYYPEIFIEMSNGVSSLGGSIVGSVAFESFGEIAMYRSSGFEGICIGNLRIKERYDTHFGSNSGGQVTITNVETESNNFMNEINSIYLNNKLCEFSVQEGDQNTLLVTLPENVRSGTLLAESLGRYNYFRFPFVVKV